MKRRTWTIRPGDNDKTLAEVVAGILRASRKHPTAASPKANVRIDGRICRQPGRSVRPGQHVQVAAAERAEPAHSTPRPFRQKPPKEAQKLRIVYQDDDLVIV